MFCAMLTKFHYITNLKKWDFGHFTEPPSPPLLIEVPDYWQLVIGRIGNFRDLVESKYFSFFEGDLDLTWDLTNLLWNLNLFSQQKSNLL
jgi:hypothetical protein